MDEEIDELCFSMCSSMKTHDREEIDILEEMMEKLNMENDPIVLREYMNEVSRNIYRYHLNFIHDIHKHNNGFDYLDEIKNSCNTFRNMWQIFIENQEKSSTNDIYILRDKALDLFNWIIRSVEEYNQRENEEIQKNEEIQNNEEIQ